jgi:predicted DCC family thiol-disulfide oxidoreductase YuxK
VLLYDGVCALCNRFVRWIVRHDRHGTMRFATLQGDLGQEAIRLMPQLATVDSVVLLYRDGAFVRSTAVLEVARYLGGIWLFALAGYLVPRIVRDALYDAVARRRYRLFGRHESCPVPPPEMHARFLEDFRA